MNSRTPLAIGLLCIGLGLPMVLAGTTSTHGQAAAPRAAAPTAAPRSVPAAHNTCDLLAYVAAQPAGTPVNAVALMPTLPPPPTATPAETPIADLGVLARRADAVAEVRIAGTNGAMHSIILYLDVQKWLKTPNGVPFKHTIVWLPLPYDSTGEQVPRLDVSDEPGDEYVLFLRSSGGSVLEDGSTDYYLTDNAASVFRIRNGRSDQSGIPRYQGWTLPQFEAALLPLLPPPQPALSDPAAQEMSALGQDSGAVADVQLLPPGAVGEEALPDGQIVQPASVLSWLKPPDDPRPTVIGVVLTAEEHRRLRSGSGRYVVFLQAAKSDSPCVASQVYGFYSLTRSLGGVFELVSGHVAFAGIRAYKGRSTAGFEATVRQLAPAPAYRTPSEGGPISLSDMAQSSAAIVEGDYAGETDSGRWLVDSFQVTKWLLRPPGYVGFTVKVAETKDGVDMGLSCQTGEPHRPTILFLSLLKVKAPEDNPGPDVYEPTYGSLGTLGVRSGFITDTSDKQYWRTPLAQFEAEVRTALHP